MSAKALASLLVLMANILLLLWACICFASPALGTNMIGVATLLFVIGYNWNL
jgi:hypothetical protein